MASLKENVAPITRSSRSPRAGGKITRAGDKTPVSSGRTPKHRDKTPRPALVAQKLRDMTPKRVLLEDQNRSCRGTPTLRFPLNLTPRRVPVIGTPSRVKHVSDSPLTPAQPKLKSKAERVLIPRTPRQQAQRVLITEQLDSPLLLGGKRMIKTTQREKPGTSRQVHVERSHHAMQKSIIPENRTTPTTSSTTSSTTSPTTSPTTSSTNTTRSTDPQTVLTPSQTSIVQESISSYDNSDNNQNNNTSPPTDRTTVLEHQHPEQCEDTSRSRIVAQSIQSVQSETETSNTMQLQLEPQQTEYPDQQTTSSDQSDFSVTGQTTCSDESDFSVTGLTTKAAEIIPSVSTIKGPLGSESIDDLTLKLKHIQDLKKQINEREQDVLKQIQQQQKQTELTGEGHTVHDAAVEGQVEGQCPWQPLPMAGIHLCKDDNNGNKILHLETVTPQPHAGLQEDNSGVQQTHTQTPQRPSPTSSASPTKKHTQDINKNVAIGNEPFPKHALSNFSDAAASSSLSLQDCVTSSASSSTVTLSDSAPANRDHANLRESSMGTDGRRVRDYRESEQVTTEGRRLFATVSVAPGLVSSSSLFCPIPVHACSVVHQGQQSERGGDSLFSGGPSDGHHGNQDSARLDLLEYTRQLLAPLTSIVFENCDEQQADEEVAFFSCSPQVLELPPSVDCRCCDPVSKVLAEEDEIHFVPIETDITTTTTTSTSQGQSLLERSAFTKYTRST